MPQLDFIIVFPQIFWLLVVFFSSYVILVHFFLPLFVKSLKVRRLIILENTKLLSLTQEKFYLKQNNLVLLLNKNFYLIKFMLESEVSTLFLQKAETDLNFLDSKIVEVLYYNILYNDVSVLSSIPLRSKFSYLKFNT